MFNLIVLGLLALVALLAIRLYRQAYDRPPNFPPGPPRLPVWGSYWLLLMKNYGFMYKATLAMAERYKTRVLGFFLGPYPAVVAMKYEEAREVFTRPEFGARPDIVQVRLRAFGKRLGIFFGDGQPWLEQKRFTLRNLRDYGFGRRYKSMEEVLREEAEELVALGRGEWRDEVTMKDGSMLLPTAFYPGVVNVLWTMMTGERFTKEQYGALREIAKFSALFVSNIDATGGAMAQTPWLHKLFPGKTSVDRVIEGTQYIANIFKRVFEEHEKEYSEDLQRDFIDRYIHEMRKTGRGKELSFTKEQLQIVATDMLQATVTNTSNTIAFAVRAIIHNPEVQYRCQKELDQVVGRGRLPTLDDRINLPYTEATLRETMRRVTLLPMSIPHMTSEDTTLGGYFLPKNTIVFCNMMHVHNDPEVWGDPENFRPDRFLDEQGVLKKDITMPFGVGKRLCPGETFSRQSMFVLFAAMLQNFHIEARDPKTLPPVEQIVNGISVQPDDFWVRLKPRF